MSCTRFELGARGSLAIVREGHTLIYLWPDEVDRLKPLLARPTPAKAITTEISSDMALPAVIRLLPDGSVSLTFVIEVLGFEGVTLDAMHANDLRATLGILKPREGETVEAMAYAIGESYGRTEARTARVHAAAMAARMLARGQWPGR